ncbi:glutathione S-transferase N-terminal domain-containing protein [Vibrio panuliri]|uniref:GST N-terminal domain-containing protein n=1 Tax=Vibrio panuliri TaxID=1381081 RepID=A0ABX3FGF8_9VIBR|nr:glutathione S-transferase family protein [Vibrio panuliri]KAB1458146.1 glutathione S-transferase [Vibrio panuliri]OLQ89473.1 hypothetical protein BIY20_01620 [Vibrio panuliri]
MKLYLNDTSPFSRVALATVLLSNQSNVELVWVDPWASPTELLQVNPFSMIPTLQLESGTNMIESLAICQFLVTKYQPIDVQALRLDDEHECALMGQAKTLMEISFKSVALGRFIELPNELHQRAIVAVQRALIELNRVLESNQTTTHIKSSLATLYLHCALDYIEFRHGELFEQYAQQPILDFMRHSPYHSLLNQISVAKLANQPSFTELNNTKI